MLSNYKIDVVNNAQIESWTSKIESLKKSKMVSEENYKKIKENEGNEIQLLTENLVDKQNQFIDAQKKLYKKREELSKAETSHYEVKISNAANQNVVYDIVSVINDFTIELIKKEIKPLEQKTSKLEIESSLIKNEISYHESNIQAAKNDLDTIEKDINTLNFKINNGPNFLNAIKNTPKKLFDKMYDKILNSLSEYDDQYPLDQDIQTQICLHEIENKLNFIKSQEIKDFDDDVKNQQIKYLMLCGAVWNMYEQVANINRTFSNRLETLLQELNIEKDGVVPDQEQLKLTPADCFDRLIKSDEKYNKLFCMKPKSFKALVPDLYQSEKQKILDLASNDKLTNQCKHTVQSLDKEIKDEISKGMQPNYQLYHSTAKVLNRFYNNPTKQRYQNQVVELANRFSGKPSNNNKIVGGLVAALGVAIVIGSVTVAGLTLGGSTLPSALGLALGASLLESEIALGATSTVGSIIGSGLTFFGIRHHKEGHRKGLYKEVMDVRDSAIKQTR